MRTKRITVGRVIVLTILLILVVIAVYPLFWMLISSFKSNSEFTMNRFGLPHNFTLANYTDAWKRANFPQFFFNSTITSLLSLLLMIGSAAMTAYAFTRYHFKITSKLLSYFTMGQMLSAQIVLTAVYLLMLILHLADNLVGLSLVYAASGLPFTIFLLQGFFQMNPKELYEAAEIDGYNEWRSFVKIALPLSGPGLATAFIIQFMYVWNEFPLALVLLNTPVNATLPLGIYRVINDMYYTSYALACAGLSIAAIPVLIVYAFFQRQIISGMTAGALKG